MLHTTTMTLNERELYKRIGTLIRERRQALGMSQIQLGKAIGMLRTSSRSRGASARASVTMRGSSSGPRAVAVAICIIILPLTISLENKLLASTILQVAKIYDSTIGICKIIKPIHGVKI